MDLTAARDQYCERLHPGLLAEPANLFSNLGFFIAAWWLWRWQTKAYMARGGVPASLRTLPILIVLIGLGSSAYHSFAQVWAEILDVGFIAIFIHWYVVCFLHERAGLHWRWAWLGVPGFILFGRLITWPFPATAFNGSVPYFPALAGLLLMSGYLRLRGEFGATRLLAAALVFVPSLALRTGDQAWCASFPLGTHWAWHLLNAAVLTLAATGLQRNESDTALRAGRQEL